MTAAPTTDVLYSQLLADAQERRMLSKRILAIQAKRELDNGGKLDWFIVLGSVLPWIEASGFIV